MTTMLVEKEKLDTSYLEKEFRDDIKWGFLSKDYLQALEGVRQKFLKRENWFKQNCAGKYVAVAGEEFFVAVSNDEMFALVKESKVALPFWSQFIPEKDDQ